MTAPFLVYGASGYTGELIARFAAARGQNAILAGRRREAIEPLATALGLEHRVAALDDATALDAALKGVPVVLHCAGPFSRMSKPMVDACLRNGAHYLDITGEIEVFEATARRDAEAKQAGVMLMPGVGFDVVPSDCLALHLKRRLPSATRLALALKPGGSSSHGTATTIVENIASGGRVRRAGQIAIVPVGHRTRAVDFGQGTEKAIAIPWGDVSTAWYSTGIPDIEVFLALPAMARLGLRSGRWFGGLLGTGPMQRLLKSRIPAGGPDEAARLRGRSHLWGEVTDDAGNRRTSRLQTPEGYQLTALAALLVVDRVLAGQAPQGYQTPAKAYGADLVMELEGVTREDLP